jgi:hypothetical protein
MSRSSPASPHVATVEPLTKPLAQTVWKKQANMGAYEDEKLGIYKNQLDDMGAVFEQARKVRAGLQAVYAERNQQILDDLAEIREDVDAKSKVLIDRLKEYAVEFEEKLGKGNKALLTQLKHDLLQAGKRYSAINKDIFRLDELIQQEVKDCQEHTTAEIKPIIARLQEHSDNLDAQMAERRVHQDEYCTTLADHFKGLREKLQVETEARKEQFVVINTQVEEHYTAINTVRDMEDVSLRERCADLREKLKAQNVDREKAQVGVCKDMLHYMDQFETAINAMNKAQADTAAKMEAVKHKTGLFN